MLPAVKVRAMPYRNEPDMIVQMMEQALADDAEDDLFYDLLVSSLVYLDIKDVTPVDDRQVMLKQTRAAIEKLRHESDLCGTWLVSHWKNDVSSMARQSVRLADEGVPHIISILLGSKPNEHTALHEIAHETDKQLSDLGVDFNISSKGFSATIKGATYKELVYAMPLQQCP